MPPASPDESGAVTPLGDGTFVVINVDGNYKGNPDPPIIMVQWNMGGSLQYKCPEYLG